MAGDEKAKRPPHGAIIGLAVGDALGAAVEFKPPARFAEVTGYRGAAAPTEPGEWTDDTSMALALADSIADVGWDLNDQAERYVKWWRTGVYSVNGRNFDIGITTVRARAVPRDQRRMEFGRSVSRASGNGSIMRLAPFPWRSSISSPTSSTCWLTGLSNRACPHMPAPNACRPAPILGWSSAAYARPFTRRVLDPQLGAGAKRSQALTRFTRKSSRLPRALSTGTPPRFKARGTWSGRWRRLSGRFMTRRIFARRFSGP